MESTNNTNLEHYLGRTRICDPNKLESYTRHLRNLISSIQQSNDTSVQGGIVPQVFISYSHKDMERVKRYTDHFKKSNIPIYIDESEFHTGDNWIEQATNFIYSANCKAVVVFLSKNSVESKAVSKEVGAAVQAAEEKFRDQTDRNRFIIPINLEYETPHSYLYGKLDKRHSVESGGFSSKTYQYADKIAECITSDNIHQSSDNWDIDVLEHDIKERLKVKLDGTLIESQRDYNDLEYAVASFYAFLKFGDEFKGSKKSDIDHDFTNTPINGKFCIFPLVTSVKETNIKRDNVTLMGYEIVGGTDLSNKSTNYILSSRKLPPDDYYCIPNGKTTAKDCAWMVEPLLINDYLFMRPPTEDRK